MRAVIRYGLGFLVLALLWQAGSVLMGEALLPDVPSTLWAFVEACQQASFWDAVAVSSVRLTVGLFTAMGVAFPLGLLMGHCPKADRLLSPLLFITFPIPKIVLLPVFFTLVGLGDASRILLIGLTVGYQMLVIIRDDALNLDPAYIKSFRSMGGTGCQAIWHVYLPAALPSLFSSLKVAAGTAMAVLFLAESFATTSGLGYLIMDAWGLGDVLTMFVAILGMSGLGLALYGGISLVERVLCPWSVREKRKN